MRHVIRLTALCVLLAVLSDARADQASSPTPVKAAIAGQQATITFSTQPPRPSSRLKYREGPVCMCSGGLSESDIAAAQSPVAAPAATPPADDARPTEKGESQ